MIENPYQRDSNIYPDYPDRAQAFEEGATAMLLAIKALIKDRVAEIEDTNPPFSAETEAVGGMLEILEMLGGDNATT